MADSKDLLIGESYRMMRGVDKILIDDVSDELSTIQAEQMEDSLRKLEVTFGVLKEYMVCMPNTHTPKQVGLIRGFTKSNQTYSRLLSFEFKPYTTPREPRHSYFCNLDGSPVFAGCVFGDMEKYMAVLDDATEEDLAKLLTDEVARNQLNLAIKV